MATAFMSALGPGAVQGQAPAPTSDADTGAGWGRVPFQHGLRDRHGISGMDAVAVGPAGFVAVGHSPVGAAAWWSADGVEWHRAPTLPDWRARTQWRSAILADIVATEHGFVAVGSSARRAGAVWASSDGRRWEQTADRLGAGLDRVVAIEGRLVAAGPGRDESARSSGPAPTPPGRPTAPRARSSYA